MRSNGSSYFERSGDLPLFGKDDIHRALGFLGLERRGYVAIGGANLVLRRLLDGTSDLDLLVDADSFDKLQRLPGALLKQPPETARLNGANNVSVAIEKPGEMPVSATTFMNDRYPMTFEGVRAGASLVDGVPCQSLEEVIASKQVTARPKDLTHLGIIRERTGLDLSIPDVPHQPSPSYAYL